MDDARAAILGEIAAEASLERSSFLTDAADQLERFLRGNRDRLRDLGGLVLIDEDPDYLSVAPDGTFRSRTRYQDEATGEWVSETEIIESAAELVELYNLAEVFAAFTEAAREEAGMPARPTGAEDMDEMVVGEGLAVELGSTDVYAQAADDWAAGTGGAAEPTTPAEAARQLYDLALTYQERSQEAEANLLDLFQEDARSLAAMVGDQMLLDDDDERVWFRSSGAFQAEVVPEREEEGEGEGEGEGEAEAPWQPLSSADEMVQFYDPTDLFGDLAEAIAEGYPEVVPDAEGENGEDGPA